MRDTSNPTYRYFAQEAQIAHDAINLNAGVRVKGAVHVQNVNAYHGFQAVAAPLSRRCHRVYPDNYLGWLRALDGHHADSGQAVLTTALGRFPHPTVT